MEIRDAQALSVKVQCVEKREGMVSTPLVTAVVGKVGNTEKYETISINSNIFQWMKIEESYQENRLK